MRTQLYDEVLTSSRWAGMRGAMLEACGRGCELCGEGPPLQLHHVTYRTLGFEQPCDLVMVCVDCHESIHNENADLAAEARGVAASHGWEWDF